MKFREILLKRYKDARVLADCSRLFMIEAREAVSRGDLSLFTYYRACAQHIFAKYVSLSSWRIG